MNAKPTSASDNWYATVEKTSQTDDERIKDITVLPPPEHLIRFFPIRGTAVETLISKTRKSIHNIIQGKDDRLLVVVGPCSIHDPMAALEYARKLVEQRKKYEGSLEIVMRVYFEKPRTTVGWKGLINDPYLDETFRIDEGLRIARQLLIDINRLGLPAGSEFLDVISPQYIGDLISWGAIGARTTESQVHRELASGLSAPIGFKNGTDGNIRIATDAIQAAARGHHFLSVHKNGQVAIVQTNGNKDCHVILRGGKAPNYDAASVAAACKELEASKLPATLMVDCSHANSSKQHEKQVDVARDIAGQVAGGSRHVFGLMVESHLNPGAQKFTPGKDDAKALEYGKSITDACLGWGDSLDVLEVLSAAVLKRRAAK
ncbi:MULTISPECIES: 3-deoxy-7-phosphoheptulonate synthase [unclassified Polaromonas]|uniref:3-deoxy-7-phosphoheptulonate synthase n=1 Tax=unclassified Polaromonas TaxID=2638319 RepID=UPI000F0782D8|nr:MULTISPECIES: 3-deoxy-7-phosphoheptulonate synthase [unclassified Polaromonas]AYQ27053.1 3-deoxy-7-phosphoheptulonate synthase [Polaromonas sp. SP1]QGJ18102.1 3-deoxy-7-phosphoheptulonate synthase [Polaromonas sp. Pch-P]